MDTLSIRIKIADREYPMTIKSEDEENIRKAGKILNERLKTYRNKFGIDDKEDLLAMVAFDSLVETLSSENSRASSEDELVQRIQHLNQVVGRVL